MNTIKKGRGKREGKGREQVTTKKGDGGKGRASKQQEGVWRSGKEKGPNNQKLSFIHA